MNNGDQIIKYSVSSVINSKKLLNILINIKSVSVAWSREMSFLLTLNNFYVIQSNQNI